MMQGFVDHCKDFGFDFECFAKLLGFHEILLAAEMRIE